MQTASTEKDRLEQKQRVVRKLKEEMKMEHEPMFFKPWDNPFDGQLYFVYNHKYFEHNRPNQDWKDSPDIFSSEDVTKESITPNPK